MTGPNEASRAEASFISRSLSNFCQLICPGFGNSVRHQVKERGIEKIVENNMGEWLRICIFHSRRRCRFPHPLQRKKGIESQILDRQHVSRISDFGATLASCRWRLGSDTSMVSPAYDGYHELELSSLPIPPNAFSDQPNAAYAACGQHPMMVAGYLATPPANP